MHIHCVSHSVHNIIECMRGVYVLIKHSSFYLYTFVLGHCPYYTVLTSRYPVEYPQSFVLGGKKIFRSGGGGGGGGGGGQGGERKLKERRHEEMERKKKENHGIELSSRVSISNRVKCLTRRLLWLSLGFYCERKESDLWHFAYATAHACVRTNRQTRAIIYTAVLQNLAKKSPTVRRQFHTCAKFPIHF